MLLFITATKCCIYRLITSFAWANLIIYHCSRVVTLKFFLQNNYPKT